MKQSKFILNKAYKIKFYDHCCGSKRPMVCEVVGFVIKDRPDYVSLSHWVTKTDCEETRESNLEPTTLMKSCVISKRKLT